MFFLRHEIPTPQDRHQGPIMAEAGATQDTWPGEAPEVFSSEETDSVTLQIQDFGCHLTWRELTRLDSLMLKRFQDVLAGETWRYEDRPTYFTAVRNLQGFIEYKLDNELKAEEYFLEVLRYDHENICALGNMINLLKDQCRDSEVQTYKTILRAIFEKSLGRSGYCETYPHRALAYADKAHAIRYFEQDKRCFRYMIYVERAATIGRYCSNSPQRAEWFFDHALALYRRDVQMLYIRRISDSVSEVFQRKITSGYERAIRLFYDVTQMRTNTVYQSLSWVFIGILLNHDPESRSLSRIFPPSSDVATMTADDCYRRGLSIDDLYEITTRRVGAEYVKLRRYKEAKALLDKSINTLKSWFAHRYRGVLYLSMYEDTNLTDDELIAQHDVTPRTNLLHMAKEDFLKAQKERIVHADYSDLGQVHFLLGEHRQAKAKFKKALDIEQDDYFDVLETYRRWIRCVGNNSPDEIARLNERAMELRRRFLETPLDTNGDSFSDDFEHYSRSALPEHERILTEEDFWVASTSGSTRRLSEAYTNEIPQGQYKYDFFLSFHERDRIWSLALFNKLEIDKGLRGCIEQRDFVVGDDHTDTIKSSLRSSFRVIVVLSQHYVDCPDAKSIVREAERVAFRRTSGDGRYVLPIVLSDCDVAELSDYLDGLECIECNLGQISARHWGNLIASLRQ